MANLQTVYRVIEEITASGRKFTSVKDFLFDLRQILMLDNSVLIYAIPDDFGISGDVFSGNEDSKDWDCIHPTKIIVDLASETGKFDFICVPYKIELEPDDSEYIENAGDLIIIG